MISALHQAQRMNLRMPKTGPRVGWILGTALATTGPDGCVDIGGPVDSRDPLRRKFGSRDSRFKPAMSDQGNGIERSARFAPWHAIVSILFLTLLLLLAAILYFSLGAGKCLSSFDLRQARDGRQVSEYR